MSFFSKQSGLSNLWGLIIVGGLIGAIIFIVVGSAAIVGNFTSSIGTDKPMINSDATSTSTATSAGSETNSGIGCNNVPIFKQCDSRWKNTNYGNCKGESTICSSGCGVTSAAMVLTFYGKTVDPVLMAQESANNGHRICGAGTSHGFFPFIAKKYGLKNENGISWNRAMELLKQGKPIITSGKGPRPFSSGGHFIVLTCYNSDGTISVNDPAHPNAKYPESYLKSHQHFISAIYQ